MFWFKLERNVTMKYECIVDNFVIKNFVWHPSVKYCTYLGLIDNNEILLEFNDTDRTRIAVNKEYFQKYFRKIKIDE